MIEEQVRESVTRAVAALSAVSPTEVRLDHKLVDLGIDSLDLVEIALLVEDEVGGVLSADLLYEAERVQEVVDRFVLALRDLEEF